MAGKNVIRQDVVEISFEVRDDPVEKVGKSADRMKTSVVSATATSPVIWPILACLLDATSDTSTLEAPPACAAEAVSLPSVAE